MEIRCEIVAKTDIGRQRSRNEDNFLILDEFAFVSVADGMGGHVDGDVASKTAVDTMEGMYSEQYSSIVSSLKEDKEKLIQEQEKFLITSIQEANKNIMELNRGSFALEGMGTTVVSLQISGDKVIIAWVGDSRIYCLRNSELKQISEDHSLVGELARHNIIGKKDMMFWQNKNIITRALGMSENVKVDSSLHSLEVGDVFLLCTDGLSDHVTDEVVEEIVLKNLEDSEQLLTELINEANDAGGPDNITVALVKTFPVEE